MNNNVQEFHEFRLKAAENFAQTMIIVDDEADNSGIKPDPVPASRPKPGRKHRPKADVKSSTAISSRIEHKLDAKRIIEESMDLGLICSVMRPAEREQEQEKFRRRVVTASKAADIVCLDWEMYQDGGDAATKIIRGILEKDAEMNGRIRLIAIYTGDTTNIEIMEKVFKEIPNEIITKRELELGDLEITGKSGVKIVCLFKTYGIQKEGSNHVPESELPKRLQKEFAGLSEGLLSNVALATIASIRKISHQILARFAGELDGPWLHHRAVLKNPEDSEEYAVNIVLSEIKGSIDIQSVGADHAGKPAIEARIREIARESNHGNDSKLKLHYSDGNPKSYDIETDDVMRVLKDGKDGIQRLNGSKRLKNAIEQNFSTLFCSSAEDAVLRMDRFSSLTSVRSFPGSYLCQQGWTPALGLGTIIKRIYEDQEQEGEYLLCLQASCDSVRIEDIGRFVFVKLEAVEYDPTERPGHVIPVRDSCGNISYVRLNVPKDTYCSIITVSFKSSDNHTVRAELNQDQNEFIFKDASCKNNKYSWIADLKRRRALKTAQSLGQKMGRLGFDEFEPYRKP